MTLLTYEIFDTVVQEKSFQKASVLLNMTPSAVSHAISNMEKEVGFALFFHNFSTFLGRAGIYLEDLYVKPDYRGHGHGKALIEELASIACARGCGRLEWSCLDWNRPSIDFYLSLGAQQMDEWTVYRFEGESLAALAERK